MLNLFVNVGYVILLVNLIIFFIGFSKHGKAYMIFTWYLGMIFIIQMVSKIMIEFHFQNLFTTHFYFIGQLVLLSFFYLAILKENYQKRIVRIGLVLVLLALAIQYSYDTSLFYKFNLFEIFITSFLLIIYATFHLYNMLNGKKEFYYINIGIIIYLFGSSILYLVGNLTTVISPKISSKTWILNAFLYVIYQVLILMEWKKSYYKKSIQ
jgi:hypothetical protein